MSGTCRNRRDTHYDINLSSLMIYGILPALCQAHQDYVYEHHELYCATPSPNLPPPPPTPDKVISFPFCKISNILYLYKREAN